MEAEAASLRTDTLSISSGLMADKSPSTPSIRIKGFAFPIVPIPRTRMVVFEFPGSPVAFTTVTPGSIP